eukprot:scaffold609_cov170-Amphora_coffeaeformis.AAC.2
MPIRDCKSTKALAPHAWVLLSFVLVSGDRGRCRSRAILSMRYTHMTMNGENKALQSRVVRKGRWQPASLLRTTRCGKCSSSLY